MMKTKDEQEGAAFASGMQKLADEWRKKLEDPAFQRMIKNRQVRVSPLIKQLLTAFPKETD